MSDDYPVHPMSLLRLPARFAAFTYVELMMVLGILCVLLSLSVLSIGPLISKTNVVSQGQVLLADAASMQLKSMRREQGGTGQITPFGIHFETHKYVLFQGSTYNANDAENVVVPLPNDITFSSISLPSAVILFERGSGDFVGYAAATSSVVMTQSSSGTSVVIRFNRYGIPELIQ